MRRLFGSLRLRHFVVAALLVFAVAWIGARYGPDLKKSPFVLWDFRAGMRFKAMDDIAYRQTRRRFVCEEPMDRTRLCELRTTGIRGVIKVFVELQFYPYAESPLMREEGRRLAATWNKVREGVADERGGPRDPITRTRWSSPDNRWGALMRYARPEKTPFDIQLMDRGRLANVASPYANGTPAQTCISNRADGSATFSDNGDGWVSPR